MEQLMVNELKKMTNKGKEMVDEMEKVKEKGKDMVKKEREEKRRKEEEKEQQKEEAEVVKEMNTMAVDLRGGEGGNVENVKKKMDEMMEMVANAERKIKTFDKGTANTFKTVTTQVKRALKWAEYFVSVTIRRLEELREGSVSQAVNVTDIVQRVVKIARRLVRRLDVRMHASVLVAAAAAQKVEGVPENGIWGEFEKALKKVSEWAKEEDRTEFDEHVTKAKKLVKKYVQMVPKSTNTSPGERSGIVEYSLCIKYILEKLFEEEYTENILKHEQDLLGKGVSLY